MSQLGRSTKASTSIQKFGLTQAITRSSPSLISTMLAARTRPFGARALRQFGLQTRSLHAAGPNRSTRPVEGTLSKDLNSPTRSPRHFLSIADLSSNELATLMWRSAQLKQQLSKATNSQLPPPPKPVLVRQTLAMLFNKRSTRTRVSCEAAITRLDGHPMFLSPQDIQLGVNESLRDTSVVLSSMTAGIIARVAAHADIVELARWSSVPVINALSDDRHPLQSLADFLTIWQNLVSARAQSKTVADHSEQNVLRSLKGTKIAWVGDANNVLFDLATAAMKLGVHISVAAPSGYEIPKPMRELITAEASGVEDAGTLTETSVPEEAVHDADFIFTDTWISMGWEAETQARLKAFEGFQITEDLAKRGGAKADWKFMHCLPRHADEVSDDVFYGDRSLVFEEAENRLWTTMAVLEAFVAHNGKIIGQSSD